MLSTPVRTLSASKCPPRRSAHLQSGVQNRAKAKNLNSEPLPPPTRTPASKVCADCRTSMTPLWRKGPDGPKSLCNACGIRYRKRRPERSNGASKTKATKSSDDGGAGAGTEAMSVEVLQRKQREKQERMLLLQFQSRVSGGGGVGGGGGGAVYGKKETEAALLLMSLSTGIFVHSQ